MSFCAAAAAERRVTSSRAADEGRISRPTPAAVVEVGESAADGISSLYPSAVTASMYGERSWTAAAVANELGSRSADSRARVHVRPRASLPAL